MMYNITIDTSYVGDSIKIVDTITHSLIIAFGNTTGASPWTIFAPVFFYNPVVTDDQISGPGVFFNGPVTKITYNTDTITGILNYYFLNVPNPCMYGTVSGKVYIDNNVNCLYDTGDTALNGIVVTSNANLSSRSVSTISEIGYTGSTGTYSITVQKSWMTNYTVSLPPPITLSSSPSALVFRDHIPIPHCHRPELTFRWSAPAMLMYIVMQSLPVLSGLQLLSSCSLLLVTSVATRPPAK